jgi:hypothetical protein
LLFLSSVYAVANYKLAPRASSFVAALSQATFSAELSSALFIFEGILAGLPAGQFTHQVFQVS